ncbi:unknown [Clostridium sp. CAG:575]|nr:unknown [Clostridium sp. CAG:575]
MNKLNLNKKIKKEKGSVTLFVLVSMLFFMFVLVGMYVNTSNKVAKQEREVNKIQQSYEQVDINDIYNKKIQEKDDNY